MSILDDIFDRNAGAAPAQVAVTAPTPAGRNPRYVQRAYDAEMQALAAAPEGTRNDALNRAAFALGTLVAGGELDGTEVANALRNTGLNIGLDAAEVEATVRSGMSSGAKSPRTAPEPTVRAVSDTTDDSWIDKATGEIIDQAPDASTVADFWSSRQALAVIRDIAHLQMSAPWATLGNALAHVIAATPHDIVLPATIGGRGSLNLFVGIVGPSGSGKGASSRVADSAIDIVGGYERKNVGTGEGLISAFVKPVRGGGQEWVRHNCLIDVAEIDSLAAVAKRQGATIMPVLRSAWSGETLGFQNRDSATATHVPAMEYRLALVAGIQPARADVLLGDSDGGTPQRFMWMPAQDPDGQLPDGRPRPEPWPWRGFDTMRTADAFGHTVMTLPAHVVDTIRAERLAVFRGESGAMAGHDTLARVKIAAALAILDCRLDVRDEDWDLSGVVHAVSLATRADVQRRLGESRRRANLAAGEAEAARATIVDEEREEAAIRRTAKRVLKHLQVRGSATAREIRATTSSRDRAHIDPALDRLVASGQVRIGRESKAGTDVFEVADE